MAEIKIPAEPRTEFGKGAARRIRRADRVPAVLYEHGNDPVHISVPGHDLMLALKNSNALLSIDIGGNNHLAIPKQVQRDPIKGFIEHADLLIVRRGEKVVVDIPVIVTGEVISGSLTVTELNEISVEAEATHLPESVEVSVQDLDAGAQIFASELNLPSGVDLQTDPESLVVHVIAERTEAQMEAELAEAEEEVGIEHDEPEVVGESSEESAEEARDSIAVSDETWLIVGLGNPGPKYAATRHNIGYLVADEIADRVGGSWRKHKSGRAEVIEARLGGIPGVRVVLMRARSYMNESGGPVSTVAKFYDVAPGHVVAIHDELDLDFGRLRVKYAGGDNGHNGLRSMRQSLGTGDFYRVRFGVGRPPGRQPTADYVLRAFGATERKDLPYEVGRAADATESVILRGLADTQSDYNG